MKTNKIIQSGVIAGIIAAILNIIVFYIAKSVGSITDSIFLPTGQPLTLLPVIIGTFLGGIAASIVFKGLTNITKNPVKSFTIIGLVFLVLSLAGPIASPNLPAGMRITLSLMHVIAGAIIIYYVTYKYNDAINR